MPEHVVYKTQTFTFWFFWQPNSIYIHMYRCISRLKRLSVCIKPGKREQLNLLVCELMGCVMVQTSDIVFNMSNL